MKILLLPLAVLVLSFVPALAQTENTSTGSGALHVDQNGSGAIGDVNVADGFNALYSNTSGFFNIATGGYALYTNTGGSDNVAIGYSALFDNTAANDNVAIGFSSLINNQTGNDNVACGSASLYGNTTGPFNVAIGYQSLYKNTIGSNNVAAGTNALVFNVSGNENVAAGGNALYTLTAGNDNIALGYKSLFNTTGNNNIGIGENAGLHIRSGKNNIDIGSDGASNQTAAIYLGTQGTQKSTFIAGIFGVTSTGGAPVYVNSQGQLGTLTSSAKFKQKIRDMGTASDALLALRPVSFEYKPEIDPAATPQFGLIAEEVEKVSPDLVVHDADHKIYTVRYEAVNAMLLNEFQKQHKVITDQQQTIAQQQKLLEALTARLDKVEKAEKK